MAPWRVVLAVVALGIVTPAVADPIPEGLAEQSVMLGQNQMAAFTYRPAQCPQPSLLLLFHGNGGAQHYRDYARVLADKTCMIVVAPRFDKKRFSGADYQRGGIVRKREVLPASDWTVNVVTDLAYFDLIVPCGIPDVVMTTMVREANAPDLRMRDVRASVVRAFCTVFGVRAVPEPSTVLDPLLSGRQAGRNAD